MTPLRIDGASGRTETAGLARQYRLATGVVIAFVFAFRAWFLTLLPLSGDEAYHWEWSRHLAPGYHDHPGLTAWLIWLSTRLLGTSEFTVRLPALLCLTGTWLVVGAFARHVVLGRGGPAAAAERARFLAVLFVMFAPVTAVLSMYMSTDPPLLLLWSLTLYLGYRAFESGGLGLWLGAGAAFGLALESKFLALLLVLPACAYVALARRDLRLRVAPMAVAALVAALMLVPLLVWNATHDWETFRFNFVSRQEKNTGAWFQPPVFVLSQLAVLSPGLAVLALLGLPHAWRDWRRTRQRSSLFLFLCTGVPLGVFVLLSFRRNVGIHWPAAAWLAAIVYAAAALGLGWQRPRLLRWTLGLAIGMTAGLHLLACVPQRWLNLDVAWFDRPDRVRLRAFAERFGWRELGHAVADHRAAMHSASGRPVFLAASQYGVAASLAFYVPGRPATHLWSETRAHGDNYLHWDDFAVLRGQDAIFVAKRDAADHLPTLRARFAHVEDIVELPVVIDGAVVRSFFLVRCHGFDGEPPFPAAGSLPHANR